MRARALYDNEAETPDELSFRRDDILTVLEQDTDGIEGWWLCQLGQYIGIAPGNRLKVISYTSPPISGSTDLKIVIQRPADDISPASDYDVPQCMTPSLAVPRLGGGKLAKSYSAGDLLAGATSDDYDTPSCASDYDTPMSNPRETTDSSQQKDAKLKTHKTKTGKKIKNFFKREQRSSVTAPDHDLYDTPTPSKRATKSSSSHRKTESAEKVEARAAKDKTNKKTKNQLNPKDCNSEDGGDSSLSDYDVPYSSSLSTTIGRNNTGKCADAGNRGSPVLGIKYREKIECPAGNGVSQDTNILNNSTALKLDDLITSFKSLRSELLIVLQQIDENSPKWFASKNALTRASVVRLTCFSAWKKLQTLLGCVSQITAGMTRDNSRTSEDTNLSTSLKLLHEQSNSLEKIIEFLTTQKSESLENDNCGYVHSAVIISSEIRRILELVTADIDEHKTLLASNSGVPALKIMVTHPSMEFLDGCKTSDEVRRTGGLTKNNNAFSKSSSNLCDDSRDKTGAKRELVARRSMDDILGATEDYDTPTTNRNRVPVFNPSAAMIVPATLRENRNITLLKHNADVKSFDVVKEKRGAVVMDKGEHKFDILVRRYSDSKMAPSVMVFGLTKGGEDTRGEGETGQTEEMVDYDYPLPSAEVESQNHMSLADKQLLQFYAREIIDETTVLKTACSQLFRLVDADSSNKDVNQSKTIVALAKTVLVSTHKLSFIADTVLKNLMPGPLKARILLRSEELCKGDNVKAILTHAKMAAVGDANSASSALSRKRLAETAMDMLLSAFQFAEIISRPH